MLSHSWPCHRTCTRIQGSSIVFGTEERKTWCNNRNSSWHFTECLLYMRPFMAGWCPLVLVRVLEGCHYPHLRVVARRRSITHPRSQRYWVAGLGSDATTCTLNHHSERLTCSVLTLPHQHHGPAWAHAFRPAGAEGSALTVHPGFQHSSFLSPPYADTLQQQPYLLCWPRCCWPWICGWLPLCTCSCRCAPPWPSLSTRPRCHACCVLQSPCPSGLWFPETTGPGASLEWYTWCGDHPLLWSFPWGWCGTWD